jgi:hypothetical protein
MHSSKAVGGIVVIITESGPGRSEFLDLPLVKTKLAAEEMLDYVLFIPFGSFIFFFTV